MSKNEKKITNNFLALKGRYKDYKDKIKISKKARMLLVDEATEKNAKDFLGDWLIKTGNFLGVLATLGLTYYFQKDRQNLKVHYLTRYSFFPFDRTSLYNIIKKPFRNGVTEPTKKDYLVFCGYSFYKYGNLKSKYGINLGEKITNLKNKIISDIRYAINHKVSDEKIETFYYYDEVPYVFRNKKNHFENSFYFTIGDGNFLFAKVQSINRLLRTATVIFVLYDDYNWADDVVYFLNPSLGKGDISYNYVVETAAFKKYESMGLAKPFVVFFVDTMFLIY